jgi:hypothetical protein
MHLMKNKSDEASLQIKSYHPEETLGLSQSNLIFPEKLKIRPKKVINKKKI